MKLIIAISLIAVTLAGCVIVPEHRRPPHPFRCYGPGCYQRW